MLVAIASIALPWFEAFLPVAVSQATAHAAAAIFAPALAAISLGIGGHEAFTRRIGRNESFNHAGNAVAAGAAGMLAYRFGPTVVFYLLAFNSAASLFAVLAIPERAIDHELARGLHDEAPSSRATAHSQDEQPSGLQVLLTCRPLMIFACCVVLFHLANAAMLPLVGQKLALKDQNLGTSLMSACIVAAQLVMVPMAMLVGAKADVWGRKPLFVAGFLILPIRGVLYTLSDNSFWLVGVQLLDGVGAGIFGALFPVIVTDLMRGTGRFNVAQGAIATEQGIGAAMSTTFAGLVVVEAGYSAAFLTLAAVAAAGLVLFSYAMPETLDSSENRATAARIAAAGAAG
jgi:Major Facilitator Superfamily